MNLATVRNAFAVSLLLTATLFSQSPAPGEEVATGRGVYLRECAPCHGQAATGHGPAAWALKHQAPDLTRYTDRTVPFPRESIRNGITGHIRLEPSHNFTQMPFWRTSLDAPGPVPGTSLMDALLAYLDSIQLRSFGPYQGPSRQMIAAAGKPLFERHCTACHGADGRGPRPPQYTVGISMDLTTLASRNAGAFESRRVYELIARCDADIRDPGAMPSWQQAFTHRGWGDYLTMKNIEALAAYIESIQR
jgi:mono/diheme cytochrome c family protein